MEIGQRVSILCAYSTQLIGMFVMLMFSLQQFRTKQFYLKIFSDIQNNL